MSKMPKRKQLEKIKKRKKPLPRLHDREDTGGLRYSEIEKECLDTFVQLKERVRKLELQQFCAEGISQACVRDLTAQKLINNVIWLALSVVIGLQIVLFFTR